MTKPSHQHSAAQILAISTYELGHQPLVLANLASAFELAGLPYRLIDNSVANCTFLVKDDFALSNGSLPSHIVISMPMHTATQLGKTVAKRARVMFGSSIKLIAYGLYAEVAIADGDLFDAAVPDGDPNSILKLLGVRTGRNSTRGEVPNRESLPGIQNYAHFIASNSKKLVGYVETTVGCAHSCRHCPVPVVFGGTFRSIPAKTVLIEIDDLYAEGARHITFGDPDFLNGPAHALRIVRAMHQNHPDLTFDATVKVEHVLEQQGIWDEMAEMGLRFIVSAFEHTSDLILDKLQKGHSKLDMVQALSILRAAGIEVRPSLLPFTPWTQSTDLIELLDFIFEQDLAGSIDPVQLSIRLLLPLGSLVLEDPDVSIGPWDPSMLSFSWVSLDPLVDQLQRQFAAMAEEAELSEADPRLTFALMRDAAYSHFGLKPVPLTSPIAEPRDRPRLSESWFCCAEPTSLQRNNLG